MFGDSLDLHISHDTANSLIHHIGTGDLILKQDRTDGDIIFQSDDGSGGTATYLTIDGSATKIQADKDVCLSDGVYLYMGSDNDFDARHNGTDFQARCSKGDMVFIQADSDQDMVFQCDNGSGSPTPYITLDGGNTRTNIHKDLQFTDNVKGKFGTSGDLEIFHDATNSYIENKSAGGDLYIKNGANNKDIILESDSEEYMRLDGSEEEVVFSKKIRATAIIQSPSSSITPTNNGELVVEATTNSKITFKLKGTDGVVRSAIITLS